MELRALIAGLFETVLIGLCCWNVAGNPQCEQQRACVPFTDCADFQGYVKTPFKLLPVKVQREVKLAYCGTENRATGKVPKIFCTSPIKSGRELLDLNSCGKSAKQRIAHGQIAAVFEFPWMALLRHNETGSFHCGGSLIAARYVLTAAHCHQHNSEVRFARLGETDLSTPIDCIRYAGGEEDCAEPPQDIKVEKFIKHCSYSKSKKKNDIALARLERSAQFNDNVRPICLPLAEIALNNLPPKMLVSGWGYTDYEWTTSNQLRFAFIPVSEQHRCNHFLQRMGTDWTVDESQLCAGAGEDLADNCQGDSGGPLQYFANTGYVIHGVVSYGQSICGTAAEPGVYTKVQHYMDWILANLK